MTTSVFFNNLNHYGEQTLLEDLIIESIKVYGHDLYYCPRTLVAKDDIYGEDTISEYNTSYLVDMYIRSYDSYEGDGTFLSKFNIEIRDQIKFVIARRTFHKEIGDHEVIIRPREGDLLYSPMMGRLFVIQYVNNSPIFYQLGSLQTYELTCEVFEYSNETLNTGIEEIDSIAANFNMSPANADFLTNDEFSIVDENGLPISQGQFSFDAQNQDTLADNDEFEQENEDDEVIDFSTRDPFSEAL